MNGFLLDTQAAIWYLDGNALLSKNIIDLISDPSNNLFVSRVSFWEIAIKVSLGKLSLGVDLSTMMDHCQKAGFIILGLENEHILELQNLPFHHKDPFDRLLISQCKAEEIDIISSDFAFDAYPVNRIWM